MVALNTAAARFSLSPIRALAREGFDGWAVDASIFGVTLTAEFAYAAGVSPTLTFIDADGETLISILCGGGHSGVFFRGEFLGGVEDLDGEAAEVAAALFAVARAVREIEAEAEALIYHRAA